MRACALSTVASSFSSDYVREYILRSSQKEIDAKSSPSNRSSPPKDSIEDRHFLPPFSLVWTASSADPETLSPRESHAYAR